MHASRVVRRMLQLVGDSRPGRRGDQDDDRAEHRTSDRFQREGHAILNFPDQGRNSTKRQSVGST